jgi:hypothetical protein
MLKIKLKHIAIFLGLIIIPNVIAADAEAEGMDYLLGLKLEEPFVRLNVGEYVTGRAGKPCKLAIGAGHITDPLALHPAYRPGGSNSLTDSIQGSGDYTFHSHEGWYTFSAETDGPFGSDMVGNIRTASHQDAIFPSNTWDLVWDESYHPGVLSAPGLFARASNSLKPSGTFIFTLPIEQTEGAWVTGHECDNKPTTSEFNETLAYAHLSMQFSSLKAVETFIRDNLKAIGFSEAHLYESPLTRALKEIPNNVDWNSLTEEETDNIT